MARLLRNLVLLTLVVELVLPVGWCCRPAKATTTAVSVNAGAEKSCCQSHQNQTALTEKPSRAHCPLLPTSKCCCSIDSVAPEKASLPPGIDPMPELFVVAPAVDLPPQVVHLVDRGAFQTGPPLNVLLCRWTC